MLSFNFNKKKEQGLKRVEIGDKVLFEATVWGEWLLTQIRLYTT